MKTEMTTLYNLKLKSFTTPRIGNLDFPWKLHIPRSRCILGATPPRPPCILWPALLKHPEPWRLRSQTTGGCAPKTLQWLRCLIAMQRLDNCNQVANALQGLGMQPPSAGISKRRAQRANGLRCTTPQGARGPDGAAFWDANGSDGFPTLHGSQTFQSGS